MNDHVDLCVELRHATEGWLAGSVEYLFAHIDQRSDEPVRFPDPIIGKLMSCAPLPHGCRARQAGAG